MINTKSKMKLLGGVLSVAAVMVFATPAEAHWHRHHQRHWHHHHKKAYVKIHL